MMRTTSRTALGVLVLACALSGGRVAAAAPPTLAITGGTVVIGDGSAPIDKGTVLLRDGRIVAAGADVRIPADAQRIDATGKWVTPGIVAGFTRLGLVELDLVESSNDTAAASSP